jgi:hypothetical protein
LALDGAGLFIEIAALNRTQRMSSQPTSASARQIIWPSVITVISAAILIGAEVFGGAFAAGWAFANLFHLEGFAVHILQGIFFLLGVAVMVRFIMNAQRVEPFTEG